MVGTRLRDDNDTNHWHTVHLHVALQVTCFEFCTADVAETDDTVVVFLDNQVVEFIGSMHQTERTDTQFHGITFDTTRRQFHVFFIHGILHVHRCDAIPCHLDRVQPETHGVLLFPPYFYTTYIGDGLQLFLYGQVCNFTHLQQSTFVTTDGYHQDRSGIGIGFRYGRRVTVTRQVALCTGNLVAHVVGCRFQVNGQLKFYGNTARTLATGTRQGTDARNTVDVLFQRFCNLVFDDIRIGSRIRARYRDNRIVHRRIFAYPQRIITDEAEKQDNQRHYGRQYGATYT